MKSKKIIIGLVLIALAVIIGGCSLANKQSPIGQKEEVSKIKIGYLPVIHNLPLYLAVSKNYFKDAGLEVELTRFEAPNQITDALINGSIDLCGPGGPLGITGIADFKNPGKMKIYAVSGEMNDNSGENIIVPKNSSLKSITDLKGKKLGILAGTIQWRTITRELLAQNGLDMDKDLTIVELALPLQVQALLSGQIDALLALEPISTTAVEKSGAKILVKAPGKQYIADPFWYGAGVINAKFAANNPQTAKKVLDVIDRAINEVNQNPDAARQYLKNYTALTDDLIAKVPPVDFKTCGSINTQDRDSIKKFFGIFTKHKVVDGEINLDNLLDCQ